MPASTLAVALTLLVGTPALTFTGMIGAALAVTLHRGGLLLAVLVLPLSIPVLIFGVAASEAAIRDRCRSERRSRSCARCRSSVL